MKSFVFKLVVSVFVAAGMMLVAPSANAADPGIDLNKYCDSQYPGSFAYAVLRGSTVIDWKCSVSCHCLFRHDVDLSRSDMQNACVRQYGRRHAYYLSYGNPYSWRCR